MVEGGHLGVLGEGTEWPQAWSSELCEGRNRLIPHQSLMLSSVSGT